MQLIHLLWRLAMKLSAARRLWILLIFALLLSACAKTDAPAKAVEAYWQALVSKDAETLANLSCGEWEAESRMVLDSFSAVETVLQDVACASSETESDAGTVKCSGKLVATYGEEKLEIDLGERDYAVVKEGGEWRVCGYR